LPNLLPHQRRPSLTSVRVTCHYRTACLSGSAALCRRNLFPHYAPSSALRVSSVDVMPVLNVARYFPLRLYQRTLSCATLQDITADIYRGTSFRFLARRAHHRAAPPHTSARLTLANTASCLLSSAVAYRAAPPLMLLAAVSQLLAPAGRAFSGSYHFHTARMRSNLPYLPAPLPFSPTYTVATACLLALLSLPPTASLPLLHACLFLPCWTLLLPCHGLI